jgi:hypothetical protein
MKKSVFLLIFVSFLILSCSSDDDSSVDTTQLVGIWYLESAELDGVEVGSSDELEFTSNGRAYFTYYDFWTAGQNITDNANYSLNNNSIVITWDEPEPGDETDTFQILELTSTILKVKSTDEEGTLIEIYTK